MPEKIAVGACVKVSLITLTGFFTDRKGQGAVGKALLDLSDQIAENLIGIVAVLTALKDEGSEAQFIAFGAAVKDLLLG